MLDNTVRTKNLIFELIPPKKSLLNDHYVFIYWFFELNYNSALIRLQILQSYDVKPNQKKKYIHTYIFRREKLFWLKFYPEYWYLLRRQKMC